MTAVGAQAMAGGFLTPAAEIGKVRPGTWTSELAGIASLQRSHRNKRGYEFHSELGLRTCKTYRPGDAEERSTVASIDITPSFREATPFVVKIALPVVIAMRSSYGPSALPSGR